jgi:putative ABC transport system substrate-binding protein
MTRRIFVLICLLPTVLLPASSSTGAQQTGKVHRVGYLSAISLSAMSERIEAFRQGLRELGYVEGKNVVIERRSAEGKEDRVPALPAELVSLKVEVIVTRWT